MVLAQNRLGGDNIEKDNREAEIGEETAKTYEETADREIGR